MNSKSEVKAGLAGAALMTVNGLLSNFSISDFEPGNEPQHENPEGIKTGSSPTGEDIRVQGKETADAGPPPVSSPTQVVQIRLNQTDPLLEDTQSEESQTGAFCEDCLRLLGQHADSELPKTAEDFLHEIDSSKLDTVLITYYQSFGRDGSELPSIWVYQLRPEYKQKGYPSVIVKTIFRSKSRDNITFVDNSGLSECPSDRYISRDYISGGGGSADLTEVLSEEVFGRVKKFLKTERSSSE
eukprot:GHVP01067440.1.p1 GENE.GHVP01067440.1~~GHVP01067440.1.p1  ORF type:complete len:242 (+),score=47.27 GHVP01067440.1:32-757(+)